MILPGKIRVKGGACAIAVATRPPGSALDCDLLRGERMLGTEDGSRPDLAGAVIGAA
jgi:hypothetical protein